MQPNRLVFLDETWATTNMTPTRGRSPRGRRCRGQAPYGHWHTTTFVCALRQAGLIAPCVLDGPINGTAFVAWVEQMLAPELRPGDIVIMDNLGSHKVSGVQKAIEAAGAQLRYLPAYSPDMNPIEQVFAKLKGAVAANGRAHPGVALERYRSAARPFLACRVRQLHPPLRLWQLSVKTL